MKFYISSCSYKLIYALKKIDRKKVLRYHFQRCGVASPMAELNLHPSDSFTTTLPTVLRRLMSWDDFIFISNVYNGYILPNSLPN